MLVINKRFIAVIAGILAACAVIAVAIFTAANVNASKSSYDLTVVIDAGHGGIDNGVCGVNTGVPESELNLAVAKLMKEDFEAAGFRVVMTRSTSAGLYGAAHASLKRTDMLNRKKIILKAEPDLVISVHMNQYALSSRRGAQVFFREGDGASARLAECVQRQLNGMEESVRDFSALKGDYYILNESPCPATLVECGFLSSPEDEALLLTEEYREKIAYTVFKGAIEFLNTAE